MPSNFGKLFSNTKVKLDATEMPIYKRVGITSQTAILHTRTGTHEKL